MSPFSKLIQTVNHSTYKLDLTGVVGLFGGNNAVDALEKIHLYAGRRWAGWYNYPGTATVARRFGQMADGRLWDSLFPGPNESPEVTFNLTGVSGPEYSGLYNGTKSRTKYLGHLIEAACADYPSELLRLLKKDGNEGRKTGHSGTVTVVTLVPQRHEGILPSITKRKHKVIPITPKRNPPIALCAIVPSLVSILAFLFCILGRDYLCAGLVLLGIISSGFSSIALGTATLQIRVPESAPTHPGDGSMFPADGNIIILKGQGVDLNVITKGEFELDFSRGILPNERYHTIGTSSLLLMMQFLLQLLLIPLCTFFGQIMLLISFIASGGYHLYVASHEREKIHRELLFQNLSIQMEKRELGTRAQMAVFACLVLGNNARRGSQMPYPEAVLNLMLPNETPVWRYWKRKVVSELLRFWKWELQGLYPCAPDIQAGPKDQAGVDEYSNFTEKDINLLNHLIDDAWCVFNGYTRW